MADIRDQGGAAAAGSAAPSGAAGGDLTGTYPDPTVGAGKITLAKQVDMATARIRGRTTAGTGVPEDLTAAQVLAMIVALLPGAGAQTADVATSETTASTSYADLATSGPAVTVVAPASGMILLTISSQITNTTSGAFNRVSFAQDAGAPADANAALVVASGAGIPNIVSSRPTIVTGLTPTTSYTFTAKYKVSAGTGTFVNRRIVGIPL